MEKYYKNTKTDNVAYNVTVSVNLPIQQEQYLK